ncbi:hypothetical protein PGB90_000434 [Kerria lacca]
MTTSSLVISRLLNKNDNSVTLKLLNKLINAICDGEHELAANTAGALAQLKAKTDNVELNSSNFSVQQKAPNTLNVRIEDKTSNQNSSLSIEINRSMTIDELEAKLNSYKMSIHNQRLVFMEPHTSTLEKTNTKSAKKSFPDEWQCPSCTLVNEASSKFCTACNRNQIENYIVNNAENNAESCRWMNENSEQETFGQKLANYQELVNIEMNNLIINLEEFECSICLETYFPGDGIVLKTCLHIFCRECLMQMIQHSVVAEVKCPYKDNNYSCEIPLQEREIKALVTPEMYEKYLTRSILEAESKIQNTFHCKTVNCPGWCIIEDEINQFDCPVCMKKNCLTCQAIHTQLQCEQYQQLIQQANDDEINKTQTELEACTSAIMLQTGEAMTCPTCRVIIMKNNGCDAITCTMCKTDICWATRGPRWGPKGTGDISGGCRCGLNGKKCHKKCQNCH